METITQEQYQQNVLARNSDKFVLANYPAHKLADALVEFSHAAQILDAIKKAYFYDKMSDEEREAVDEYFAARPHLERGVIGKRGDNRAPIILSQKQIDLFHAILGIATEAGELVSAFIAGLADVQMNNTPVEDAFDMVNMREELGDVRWYYTLGLAAINSNDDECRTINDLKLELRYGPAFTQEGAHERNLDAERKVLEGKDD